MAIVIQPIKVQSKFPVENKPSLDPKQKEIYNDVFALQNAFKILFIVLDNTFKLIQDEVNAGSGSIELGDTAPNEIAELRAQLTELTKQVNSIQQGVLL
jgi:hypothetical protein